MGIIAVLADPNDGALQSSTWRHEGGVLNSNPNFEDDARRGEGATYATGQDPDTGLRIGAGGQKWNNGDQTIRYEAFVMFKPSAGFALPSEQLEVVTSSLRVSRGKFTYDNPNDSNFGARDSLAIWNQDWNAPLSASSWFDLMSVSGSGVGTNYQPEAELSAWVLDRTVSGILYEGGGEVMVTKVRDHLAAGSDIGYVMFTWTATQVYPVSATWQVSLISSNDVLFAPKYHPTLFARTQRKHALNGIGGASIQMSDGTAVFIRYDGTTKRYNLYYQKVNATVPVLIDYLRGKVGATDNTGGDTSYYGQEPGFQAFSITRDSNDNIYVAGPRGNPQTGTYGQKIGNANCFKYNGGYSWTRYSQTVFGDNALSATDTHRGFINNTQAVWVPQGATPAGQFCVVHSRRDGQWGRYQTGVHSQSAEWLRGSTTRSPFIAYAGDDSAVSNWWRSHNPSGSNLDAFRDDNTIRMAGGISAIGSDENERSAGMTCVISSTGAVGKPNVLTPTIRNLPHDPDGKIRALWLGESSPYWAIIRAGHIMIVRKSDGGIQRQLDIPGTGIPVFPSTAVLQKSQAWDAVWDAGDPNYIWIYYRSAINPRHIQKARYDIVNGSLEAGYQWTVDPLGPSGSEIVALRLPRQQVDTRCVLVDVAMQDGAGVPLALLTIRDTTMNKEPGQPVVSAVSGFNASGSKTVIWAFKDQNPSDFATFYDLEVRNVTTGAISFSQNHLPATVNSASGRMYQFTIPANSLTNDANYELRVRAYDSVDFSSEWSAWNPFSTTSTGGYVTVTSPATDFELLNRSSLVVSWDYQNTNPAVVQTGYRVRVFNAETGAAVADSNLVSSTDTTYTITGLASDVDFRIEVQVRDSNSQLSGAGIRMIRPDFNNPSLPEIVTVSLPGRIEIRVTNPPPDGDNPVTVKNQIARKVSGEPDDSYLAIGECPPNGVYQDWTVASGVQYTYKARGSSE